MQNTTFTADFNTFDAVLLENTSADLFYKALAAGFYRKIINLITRRPSRLLDLGSLQTRMQNGHYAGLREVALDDIRGTEGRLDDFDDRFNPLTDRTRQRWQSVAKAYEVGIDLPPVELIQVGQTYFVRDGHHRVSVARARGQTTISAEVTVW
jgi:hypothetical protein